MIPPQELKNKSFTRFGKGYDMAEVDEYIDFIVEKYSEIFAQCDKYDKKLRGISARIGEIKSEEDTIHKLVISTQKNCDRLISEAEEEAKNKILSARETAERILADAREKAQSALSSIEQKSAMQIEATQEKSDALLLSARTRCTRLLSDFKKEIALQRENILNIKIISEEFNSKLLSMYKNHLNLLNENTYIPAIDLDGLTESKLFDSVMQEIRNDAGDIAKKSAGVEYDFEKELESLREGMDFGYDVGEQLKTRAPGADANKNINSNDYDEDGEEADEDDEDGDVKVFEKYGPGPSPGAGARGTAAESEKPQATYDSDDYEYDGTGEGGGDNNYSGEGYANENDGAVFDDEEFADPDDIEMEMEMEDMYDDEEGGSKGFWGLFKGKKSKKKKPPRRNKYDPGDGDEDDDEDDEEDDEDENGIYDLEDDD